MKKHPEIESLSHICNNYSPIRMFIITLCWCNITFILWEYSRYLFSRNSDFVFNPDKNIKRCDVDLPGSVYAPWKNDFSRTPIQQCSVSHRNYTLAYRHDPGTVFIVPVRYILMVVRFSTRTRPQRVRQCVRILYCRSTYDAVHCITIIIHNNIILYCFYASRE